MRRPLLPAELFPHGRTGIAVRELPLPTGVTLRVLEAGPRDGPPVVMLHGWGAAAYMYRHALAMLPARGLRVLAVDLRGFGLSDKPRTVDSYSLNLYCADLDALLDVLGLPGVSLVGQSMGGGLALRYAVRKPERVTKLALINPVCLVPIRGIGLAHLLPASVAEMCFRRAPRALIAATLKRVAYGDPSLVTQDTIDEYWSLMRLPGFVNAARSALVAFDWSRVSDAEAASLSVPTIVLLGERDHMIHNPPAAVMRLRGARLERVPGGHCANEEHPDVVYPIIEQFILQK